MFHRQAIKSSVSTILFVSARQAQSEWSNGKHITHKCDCSISRHRGRYSMHAYRTRPVVKTRSIVRIASHFRIPHHLFESPMQKIMDEYQWFAARIFSALPFLAIIYLSSESLSVAKSASSVLTCQKT
jgi:hypothetical protein